MSWMRAIGRMLVRRLPLLFIVLLIALAAFAAVWGLVWFQERPLAQAEAALVAGDVDQALLLTREFLQQHPESSRGTALRARALVAAGQPNEAIRLFNRIGPASSEELHAYARALLMLERWTTALPVLVRVLQIEPTHADALYEISVCRTRLGRLTDALDSAKRFAALPGHEPRGNVMVGTIHSDLGNPNEAADAFARVLEYRPDAKELQVAPDEFFLMYGQALLDAGKPQQALSQLERSLDLKPSARAYLLVGKARENLAQVAEAESAWREALRLDRSQTEVRECLARIALQQGDAKATLTWLEPLAARADIPASVAYLVQRAHKALGNEEAATEWRQRTDRLRQQEKVTSAVSNVLRESPQSFWAQVIRAHRFAATGNWAEAESILTLLRKEKPADKFYHDLVEAVRRRGPLPPLEQLPIKQF